MIKAAEKASKSLIRDFGEVEKLQVSKKGPYDFVTKTDRSVEKILIDELSKTKKIIHLFLKKLEKLIIMIKKIFGLLILLTVRPIFFMVFLILQLVLLLNLKKK